MQHHLGVKIPGLGQDGALVSCWDATKLAALEPRERDALARVVAEFGRLSAIAQGLATPITSLAKLQAGDQRLFLAAQRVSSASIVIYGGLKVGEKSLFVWQPGARRQQEIRTTCVLDFYVHDSVQRMGVGRQLFDAFLAAEAQQPDALAYDQPSPKLLSFLAKHYSLDVPVSLCNNFLAFPTFFQAAGNANSEAGAVNAPWESIAARPLTAMGRRRGSGGLPSSSKLLRATAAGTSTSPTRRRAASTMPSTAASAPWATSPSDSTAVQQCVALPPLSVTREASWGGISSTRVPGDHALTSASPTKIAGQSRGGAGHLMALRASPARERALAQRHGGSMRDCLSW